MTIDVEISCITKPDRQNIHERIQGVGGLHDSKRWWLPEDQAIKGVEDKTYRFYTAVAGKGVWVVVAIHNGRKYLKTEADTTTVNNLLSLPECLAK